MAGGGDPRSSSSGGDSRWSNGGGDSRWSNGGGNSSWSNDGGDLAIGESDGNAAARPRPRFCVAADEEDIRATVCIEELREVTAPRYEMVKVAFRRWRFQLSTTERKEQRPPPGSETRTQMEWGSNCDRSIVEVESTTLRLTWFLSSCG